MMMTECIHKGRTVPALDLMPSAYYFSVTYRQLLFKEIFYDKKEE